MKSYINGHSPAHSLQIERETERLLSSVLDEILPKRRIVERTFGWLHRYRRSLQRLRTA